jgi:hypothetical protein
VFLIEIASVVPWVKLETLIKHTIGSPDRTWLAGEIITGSLVIALERRRPAASSPRAITNGIAS